MLDIQPQLSNKGSNPSDPQWFFKYNDNEVFILFDADLFSKGSIRFISWACLVNTCLEHFNWQQK